MTPSAEPAPTALPAARNPSTELGPLAFGVSPRAFAILSLLALLTARGLAPALPGSATGIATWINVSGFLAACSSQLLAAGGIALCIRLLSTISALPSLGVGFRLAMLPTGLGVVLLVAAASARPLDGDLGRMLAIAASATPALAAPLLLVLRWGKRPALVLLAIAASGALELASFVAAERPFNATGWPLAALALLACLANCAAAVIAIAWSAEHQRRALRVGGVILLAVIALLAASALGASHRASVFFVLVHRSVEALAGRAAPAVPLLVNESAALILLLSAVSLLARDGRRADLRAALALCLLSGVSPGAPAAALLGVAGTLLLCTASSDPHVSPEHRARSERNETVRV